MNSRINISLNMAVFEIRTPLTFLVGFNQPPCQTIFDETCMRLVELALGWLF